jgi:hypothetical protein
LAEAGAERAGGGFEGGQAHALGVALEAGAEFAQGFELRDREIAGAGHGGVADRHDMAVREEEAVALGPVGLLGAVVEHLEVERGEDVGHAEGSGAVTGAGLDEHVDDVFADLLGLELELLVGHVIIITFLSGNASIKHKGIAFLLDLWYYVPFSVMRIN